MQMHNLRRNLSTHLRDVTFTLKPELPSQICSPLSLPIISTHKTNFVLLSFLRLPKASDPTWRRKEKDDRTIMTEPNRLEGYGGYYQMLIRYA